MSKKKPEAQQDPEMIKLNIKFCAERINRLLSKRADYFNVLNRSVLVGQDGSLITMSNDYTDKIQELDELIDTQLKVLSELKRIRDGE